MSETPMSDRLREWEQKINEMKAKAEEAGAERKAELKKEIADLERRRDEAKAKMDEAQAKGSGITDELRRGFEEAGEAISKAWTRARERF